MIAHDGPGIVPATVTGDADLVALLLATAPVGVAFFDADQRCRSVNAALTRATGRPAEDHLGHTVRELVPDAADEAEQLFRRALDSGQPVLDASLLGTVDGSGQPARWSTSWYPVSDRSGVAVVVTDVTSALGADERVRRTGRSLQRSLLPRVTPPSEELTVAVRYEAGTDDAEVGGDWYDVIALGGGRLAVVVGDVMGRGVHAAAVMGQLRTAVRTCARLDLRPAEVVDVLDGLVADLHEGHIATFAYGVYDPGTRELSLAAAGHLPPVVRSADGGVRRVHVEVSAPLGVGEASRQTTVRLEPGSVLALFTDGLVGASGSDLDVGLDALTGVLSRGSEDLEQLADALVHELTGEGVDDDVALVLLQVPRDVANRSRTAVLAVPRERSQLVDVRAEARAAMRSWALLETVVDTATVLASELATNALVHGSGRVELRLRVTRDRLVLEAEDEGHHMPRRRRAGTEEESGRGLQLVATLSDRWGARLTDTGKVVWAELDLADPSPR